MNSGEGCMPVDLGVLHHEKRAMTLRLVSGFYRRAANAVAALSIEARIPPINAAPRPANPAVVRF
jgi:hypothetical protein